MSGVWGNSITVTLFGESHGVAIGATISGLPAGFTVDLDNVRFEMARRAPGGSALATPRKEKDEFEILSGMLDGKTTGAPLTAIIRNTNTKSKDYSEIKKVMRPGQADYAGFMRYQGNNDYRGSGHFSGRITAPLVFAGAIAQQFLETKGIHVGTHVNSIADVEDRRYEVADLTAEQFASHKQVELPLLNSELEETMRNTVRQAKSEGDSVGGIVEVGVIGLPAGVGNPFFNSIESNLAQMMFSIPAIKGVEFGAGFDITRMRGFDANDSYYYDESGQVLTRTNHNGGIVGGISNGSPIIFRLAVKPPASIEKEQETINVYDKVNTTLSVKGRHDPIIVPRALPVIEAATALVIFDFMVSRGDFRYDSNY